MKPNILFLIIDSFRSDKFYGNDTSSQTPNIDDLVENGIFFPNNISAADGTILSLASMFTSLEPPKTGVKSEHYVKLDSDIINYFNLLKQEGFHAYATVPKIVSTLGILNMFENLDKTYDHFQSLSNGLGKKIIDQLNQKSMEEPWIYYVHINDIHFPIIPPKEFDKVEFGGSKYERMVSSIDPWLGKIIKNIDLKNTLVAITADHGSNIPTIKLDDEWISFETDGSRQKFITKVGNKVPTILEPVKNLCTSLPTGKCILKTIFLILFLI